MSSKDPDYKKNLDPFQEVMKSMNDFFHSRPAKGFLQTIDEFFKAPNPLFSSFPLHVEENENEHIITAELPGINKEQIQIDIIDNYITIRVKNIEVVTTEDTTQHIFRKKSSLQKMTRTVTLPHLIDESTVKARYQNGLLTIKVPNQKGKRLKIED